MIDWDALARPSLRGLVRYDPGPSRDALKAEHGLAELEPLNWNEDRFEPPRRVLEAAAAEVFNAALYPGAAVRRLPRGPRRVARRAGGVPDAGARRAGLDRVGRPGLHRPGHAGRRPAADLRPLRLGVGGGRWASSRASRPPGSRSISTRVAEAADATGARVVWICDPNNPTGTLVERAAWAHFPRPPAARLHRRRGRAVHGLRRPGSARRPSAGRGRRSRRDHHPLVLEDLRTGGTAPRVRDLGAGGGTIARPRARAVQRQPRRARRRHRRRRRAGLRRAAARTGRRSARPPDGRAGSGRPARASIALQLRARRARRGRPGRDRRAHAPRHPRSAAAASSGCLDSRG